MWCISGGGVLVSLCWDVGDGGCKRGFRGIVDVARNLSESSFLDWEIWYFSIT